MVLQKSIKPCFLTAELTVSLAVLAMLLAGLAFSLNSFSRFNRYQFARQRCIASAQAQLDSIAATGHPVEQNLCGELWPRINISILKAAGRGQWEGFELVEVTSRCEAPYREAVVRLAGYFSTERRR